MGIRERAAWLDRIDGLDVSMAVRKTMRDLVIQHDQLLASTLAALELTYLRDTQSPRPKPRARREPRATKPAP